MKRLLSLLIVLCSLGVVVGEAQIGLVTKPQVQATPDKPPQLSELERALVQIVQLSDQLAACRQQSAQKNVAEASAGVARQIEAAYPGFTINWQTGQLVPKK